MKVAIIGAGIMGSGIAQVFAVHGSYEVILCDITAELAANGKARIEKDLAKLVSKGKMDQAAHDAALGRITTGDNSAAAEGELIIEAAIEQRDLKKHVFHDLQKACSPDAIFATNTSSLSITDLSVGLDRPVMGMHFFNPAPVMKLVEVIAGLNAPPELAEKIAAIARDVGKDPVMVQDASGFIVNRLLIPMINEATGILADGTATAADIDKAMRLGANHPMGPLALGDLVGLDVCLSIMDILFNDTHDTKYRAHPLLRKMVRGGRLGKKTGRGFFEY